MNLRIRRRHWTVVLGLCGVILLATGAWWLCPGRRYAFAEELVNSKGGSDSGYLISGTFRQRVWLHANWTTEAAYVVPVDAAGRPLKSAGNIIFYAPFAGESGARFYENHAWLRDFAEEYGFSVFSLNMEADLAVAHEREKYYIYPEAGWYEVIAGIHDFMRARFHFPDLPMFIVGQSAGGSLGEMFSVCYPERVDGVAWSGGSTYLEPRSDDVPVARLALTSWGDRTVEPTLKLQKYIRQQDRQLLYGIVPPLSWEDHHGAGEYALDLITTFICALADLRTSHSNKIPDVTQWPATALLDGREIYLPSNLFLEKWRIFPQSAYFDIAEAKAASSQSIVFAEPEAGRGIVVWCGSGRYLEHVVLEDTLQYLAENDVIVVAAFPSGGTEARLEGMKVILREVLARPEWDRLPVFLAGAQSDGEVLAVAGLCTDHPRIQRISLFNSRYRHAMETFSIESHRSCASTPVSFYHTWEEWNSEVASSPYNSTFFLKNFGNNPANEWKAFLKNAISPVCAP